MIKFFSTPIKTILINDKVFYGQAYGEEYRRCGISIWSGDGTYERKISVTYGTQEGMLKKLGEELLQLKMEQQISSVTPP